MTRIALIDNWQLLTTELWNKNPPHGWQYPTTCLYSNGWATPTDKSIPEPAARWLESKQNLLLHICCENCAFAPLRSFLERMVR